LNSTSLPVRQYLGQSEVASLNMCNVSSRLLLRDIIEQLLLCVHCIY